MNVKFKLNQDVMNVADMRVRIYNKEKCIYEREIVWSDGKHDLEMLIRNLRDVQSDVNDFLTTLIQRQDASVGVTANRSIPSDTESDSVEDETEEEEEEGETRTNSKKCKLST